MTSYRLRERYPSAIGKCIHFSRELIQRSYVYTIGTSENDSFGETQLSKITKWKEISKLSLHRVPQSLDTAVTKWTKCVFSPLHQQQKLAYWSKGNTRAWTEDFRIGKSRNKNPGTLHSQHTENRRDSELCEVVEQKITVEIPINVYCGVLQIWNTLGIISKSYSTILKISWIIFKILQIYIYDSGHYNI